MTNSTVPARPAVRTGMGDLLAAAGNFESWVSLGLFDIRQRYRRSSIGPLWIVLSTAAIAGGIGFMMSAIQGRPITNVIAYIVTGIMIWQFISSALVEACNALISKSNYIRSFNQPLSAHVFRAVWVQVLIFCHTLLLYPVVVVFTGLQINWNLLWAIPGLVLLVLNVGWMGLMLSILSARFRDIPLVVGNFLSFFMFLTPVFWQPDDGLHSFAFIDYNPLYWLIQVVREPLLGHAPLPLHLLGGLGLLVVGWGLALALMSVSYRRLALWV